LNHSGLLQDVYNIHFAKFLNGVLDIFGKQNVVEYGSIY